MDDRMFSPDSFDELKDVSEVKSAVSYFSHNEIKFRSQLASEGLTHEEIENIVGQLWVKLLKLCKEYKYSDYIVETKKQIYK
jgi:hypothetical protein